jgi:hypothetical protein
MLPREVEAALRVERWSELTKRLVAYGYRRLGRAKLELAEEAAHDAVAQLFDPAYAPWDPMTHPLVERLSSVINGFIVRDRARHVVTRPLHPTGDLAPTQPGRGAPHARRVEAREAQALEALAARAAGDGVATKLIEAVRAGADTPEAQARATGEKIDAVRAARRRLAAMADEVLRDMGDGA